jgi:hypothetical protein
LTSRAGSLRRIATLYGVVEEMHAVALRQASANVQETEVAIRMEHRVAAAAAAAGRTALTAGEREEWLLTHAEGEISAVRASRFEELKTARVEVESAARTEFLASRVKTEQMKQVVTQMVERASIEEGRRTQAVSDDRYAARRAWLASRRDR